MGAIGTLDSASISASALRAIALALPPR